MNELTTTVDQDLISKNDLTSKNNNNNDNNDDNDDDNNIDVDNKDHNEQTHLSKNTYVEKDLYISVIFSKLGTKAILFQIIPTLNIPSLLFVSTGSNIIYNYISSSYYN